MKMIDIRRLLRALAAKRPVFQSEADFQHALAWEIHLQHPTHSVRLEFKPPQLDKRVYLDIWAVDKSTILAIELKYKTRLLDVRIGQESFHLLDQSAQDLARYDFLRDINRLEQIVFTRSSMGYAVFLTNDSAYWKPPRNSGTVDADFRIHQGRVLTGNLQWGTGASKGTMRSREHTISIKGVYSLNWQDYSKPSKASYGKFRYLLVEVGNQK